MNSALNVLFRFHHTHTWAKVYPVIHANEGVLSEIKFTSVATNYSFMLNTSVLNNGDIMAMDQAYPW